MFAHWGRPHAEGELEARPLAMEAQLEREQPDVLVIGSSVAGQGVVPELLAEELGDDVSVSLLTQGGSGPAHWYAILKNRVYANGHRPKVVMVFDLLSRFSDTQPVGVSGDSLLRMQIRPDDTLVLQKAYGRQAESAYMSRVRQRRDSWRTDVLAAIRDGTVGAIHGEVDAQAAVDEVFAEERVRREMTTRVIPVVESTASSSFEQADVGIRESFVPDLAALASEHGSKIVFVRSVLPRSNRGLDRVPARGLSEAIVLLNELQAGWVDLSATDVDESDFADSSHLNEGGAEKVTVALAAAVRDWDLMGDRPVPQATPPLLPSRVRREGELPVAPGMAGPPQPSARLDCVWDLPLDARWRALSDNQLLDAGLGEISPFVVFEDGAPLSGHVPARDLKKGCGGMFRHLNNGIRVAASDDQGLQVHSYEVAWDASLPIEGKDGTDGWWLFPETSLSFDFDEPLMRQPTVVMVVLQAALPGAATASLVVAGEEVPFQAYGNLLAARWRGSPGEGAWSVELRSGQGSELLAVRSLRVGEGRGASWLVGSMAAEGEEVERFIGERNPRHGGLAKTAEAVFHSSLPAVKTRRVNLGGNNGRVRFEPDPTLPTRQQLKRFGAGSCVLYDVFIDGEAIGGNGGECHKLGRAGHTTCRDGDEMVFVKPDGLGPGDEARVTVGRRPSRSCYRALLLPPSDRLTVTVPDPAAQVGPDAVEFRAWPLGNRPGDLGVTVNALDTELVDARIPYADMSDGPVRLAFSKRVPSGVPVHVELQTGAGQWVYVDLGALVTAEPFERKEMLASAEPAGAGGFVEWVGGRRAPKFKVAVAHPPIPVKAHKRLGDRSVLTVPGAGHYALDRPGEEPCLMLQVKGSSIQEAHKNSLEVSPATDVATVRPDPERRCGPAVVLYGKELLRFKPRVFPETIEAGTYSLKLEVDGASRRGARVTLRRGGEVVLNEVVAPEQLASPLEFDVTLDSAGPGQAVALVVKNLGPWPLRVTSAHLEPAP